VKPVGEWRVLIVGLGQIGGSLGLDLVGRKLVARVLGHDTDHDAAARAPERQAVHEVALSLAEGVRSVDLVIVATPIRHVCSVVKTIAPMLCSNQLVMDVAGTKLEIMQTVASLESPANFIGAHPIAGTEGAGIESARPGLFEDATFVLTPSAGFETRTKVRATQTESDADRWLAPVRELVAGLGARPVEMSAENHDRLIALTSHLPHVLALALASLAGKQREVDPQVADLIGGSFRSGTRVAASSPELIQDMLLGNRENVGRLIDAMIDELTTLRAQILAGDESALRALVERVQRSL